MSAKASKARVPLRICAWVPDGEGGEERHTVNWELVVAELPLLLDPQGKMPLHKTLVAHVQGALSGRKVDRIYWYDDRMQECTLWPSSGADLTRNIFEVLQQALSRPRESVGSGGSADIHVLMKPPPIGGAERPQSAPAAGGAADEPKKGKKAKAAAAGVAPPPAGTSDALEATDPGGSEEPPPPPPPPPPAAAGGPSLKSAALRTQLKAAEASLPNALREAVPEIDGGLTSAMLQRLLGKGSEAVLPPDDGNALGSSEVAAVLLLWARRRVRQQQARTQLMATLSTRPISPQISPDLTPHLSHISPLQARTQLTELFRRTSKVCRRLKQIMAGRPVPTPPKTDIVAVAAAIHAGNVGSAVCPERTYMPFDGKRVPGTECVLDDRYKLLGRYKVRPLLWRRGLPSTRLLDAAFVARPFGGTTWALPGACIDPESGQFMVPKQVRLTHSKPTRHLLICLPTISPPHSTSHPFSHYPFSHLLTPSHTFSNPCPHDPRGAGRPHFRHARQAGHRP